MILNLWHHFTIYSNNWFLISHITPKSSLNILLFHLHYFLYCFYRKTDIFLFVSLITFFLFNQLQKLIFLYFKFFPVRNFIEWILSHSIMQQHFLKIKMKQIWSKYQENLHLNNPIISFLNYLWKTWFILQKNAKLVDYMIYRFLL